MRQMIAVKINEKVLKKLIDRIRLEKEAGMGKAIMWRKVELYIREGLKREKKIKKPPAYL